MMNNLLNGYGKDKDKYIIFEGVNVGLGNQVSSIVGSISLALTTGRRLRSIVG